MPSSTEQGTPVRTYTPKPADITRAWHIVDADGLVLGRLATEVAAILRGKHKPIFSPNLDTGDHVIVVNADKVVLTSGKAESKLHDIREKREGLEAGQRMEVDVGRQLSGMLDGVGHPRCESVDKDDKEDPQDPGEGEHRKTAQAGRYVRIPLTHQRRDAQAGQSHQKQAAGKGV